MEISLSISLKFDDFGRFSNHPPNDNNGIVVLGDSHAMGWGENDGDTFSSILEHKINRPVYNLAVSGYGTARELIRLEKSNLINNDYLGENNCSGSNNNINSGCKKPASSSGIGGCKRIY